MREAVTWADTIASVSADYMNATVSLIDPSLVSSTFDVDTNAYVKTGNPVVASGIPARIQPIRLSVDNRGGTSGNPSGEVRMRVQFARDAYEGKIQRGWQVRVTSATRNPELESYLIVIDAVVGSSWRATTVVEGAVNVENAL